MSTALSRALILLAVLTAPSAASGEIIPETRIIDWSSAGAKTDFSARTTTCATLSPSGGDDAAAIRGAIDACPQNQVVKLNPGTFRIGSGISWGNNPNVTLRGSGPGATILQGQAGFTAGGGGSFFDFWASRDAAPDWDWTLTPAVGLVSGISKGSTRINTATAHVWAVGDYVLIDQLNNASGNPPEFCINNSTWLSRANCTRMRAQVVRVTNVVDSDTVDIFPALYFDYSLAQTPQGKKANTKLAGISIEDLTVDNHASDAPKMFWIYNLFDSRFYNLDLDGIPSGNQSRHFHVFNSFGLSIQRCTIRGAEGSQTNQGYGMFLGYAVSGLLIEDNIFRSVVLGLAFEGAASGNVVAYNYAFDSVWFDAGTNRLPILNHGGGSMNLIEGNYIVGRWREDAYFGSGHWNTVFRNRIHQDTTKIDQLQVYDLERFHHFSTAVGNVLGTSGYETIYEQNGADGATPTARVVYRLGYTGPYDQDAAGNDAQVAATLLRHGNWDSVTGGVRWDSGIVDRLIPNSLYLQTRPAFFGSCAWPPFGPDLDPMVKTLPAKDRHEGGQACTGGDTTPPAAPTGLRTQ